jgi:hypothetical protein
MEQGATMRWGGDEVGVVLTRNEVWLLLNALEGARLPAVDWEGNALEPWVAGELRARLQAALRPDPLSDVEERPIIRLDSDMGRSLAMAEVRPLVIEDGYDLGSLFAACAERGWGATLTLPVGGGVSTPAEAVVTVDGEMGRRGDGEDEGGKAERRIGEKGNDNGRRQREFVGLERPVVAFARALVGACFADGPHPQPLFREGEGSTRAFDEHVIFADAIAPGERERTIERMAGRGWELVRDDGEKLVFRRGDSR